MFDTGGSNLYLGPDALERISGRRVEAGRRVRLEGVSEAGLASGGDARLPGEPADPDGLEVFSSRGPDRRPWLEVGIGSAGRRLLIDSGSNGTIAISPDDDLLWRSAPRPLWISQGMNDLETSSVGRLAGSVVVGPSTVADLGCRRLDSPAAGERRLTVRRGGEEIEIVVGIEDLVR